MKSARIFSKVMNKQDQIKHENPYQPTTKKTNLVRLPFYHSFISGPGHVSKGRNYYLITMSTT